MKGLEPLSCSFGDCCFALNYTPIYGGLLCAIYPPMHTCLYIVRQVGTTGIGGFEPPLSESKSEVLPLHNIPIYALTCFESGARPGEEKGKKHF